VFEPICPCGDGLLYFILTPLVLIWGLSNSNFNTKELFVKVLLHYERLSSFVVLGSL
jgi:hypothetical protein